MDQKVLLRSTFWSIHLFR